MIQFMLGLAAASLAPIDKVAFLNAIESCDRDTFVSLATQRQNQIRHEYEDLRQEIRRIFEAKRQILDRKMTRDKNGPLAGVFNSYTNQAEIRTAEQDIENREQDYAMRQRIVELDVKILADQIDSFKQKCLGPQNAPNP